MVFSVLIKFFVLPPFAELSPYPCTPSVASGAFRSKSVRPEGLSHLGVTEQKRQKHCRKNSASAIFLFELKEFKVENLWFSSF